MTESNALVNAPVNADVDADVAPHKVFEYKSSFLSIFQVTNQNTLLRDLINQCVLKMYELNVLVIKPPIMIMGKQCHQQRNICNFSNVSMGYKYSGQIIKSVLLPECFKLLLNYTNNKYNSDFNSILVNEYLNGDEYIGRHADNENALNPNCGVVGLSIGATRKFRLRALNKIIDENGKEHLPPVLYEHLTGNYEFMQMGGNFQKELTHEIPKETRILDKRISFTFRHFIQTQNKK